MQQASRHSREAIAERQRIAMRRQQEQEQQTNAAVANTTAAADPSTPSVSSSHIHQSSTSSSVSTSSRDPSGTPPPVEDSAPLDSSIVSFPESLGNNNDSYSVLQNPASLVSTLPNSTSFDATLQQHDTATITAAPAVIFDSSSSVTGGSLTDSYLALLNPVSLVSTLPNSNSFDATNENDITSNNQPRHSPPSLHDEDLLSPASSSPPPLASSSPDSAKKPSHASRLASFFKRGSSSKEVVQANHHASSSSDLKMPNSSSAPSSSSNSLMSLLTRGRSGSGSARKKKKGKGDKSAKGSNDESSSSSSSPPAEEVSDTSGGGQKRSVYTQKLIHLSTSFMNMFSSQPSQLMFMNSQPHVFTNSPAWILGCVYKLLGMPPSLHGDIEPSPAVSRAQLTSLHLRRARFLSDFSTRVWSTYRKGFPTIGGSVYTSDAGWGCMIRSAQMLLAQVFVRHYLGKDWRRPECKHNEIFESDGAITPTVELPPLPPAYLRILSLFLDSPSAAAPYSIHNLLHNGQSSKDKKVGEWFGPHNACWMLKQCMEGEYVKLMTRLSSNLSSTIDSGFGSDETNDHASSSSSMMESHDFGSSPPSSTSNMPPAYAVPKIYVSDDGTLYLDKIMQLVQVAVPPEPSSPSIDDKLNAAASSSYSPSIAAPASAPSSIPHPPTFSPYFHPLLILIPLRLGVDRLNAAYVPSLLSLFQFPQCVGIIGGKPRTSLYFVGVQDDLLFYLDPHTVQKAADLTGPHSLKGGSLAMKHEIADTYHCSNVLSIQVSQIDPSLAIGFYIANQQDMDAFWEQAKQLTNVEHLQAHVAAAVHKSPSSSSASSPRSSSPAAPALLPVFHVADVSPNYASFDSDADSTNSGDVASDEYEDDEADFDCRDDATLDSPVAIQTSSLPTDASGQPLSMDSLTSSPVICPTRQPSGLEDVALPPTNNTSTASSSVSALTDMTLAFSTAAASKLTSSARSFSEFASNAATQASASVSNLAAQAAQAAQLAQRKLSSREADTTTSPTSISTEDSTSMISPVISDSTPVALESSSTASLAPSPIPATAASSSSAHTTPHRPSSSSSSSIAPLSACSTSSKPIGALRKSSSRSARAAGRAGSMRRGSKEGGGSRRSGFVDDEDEFVFL